MSRGVNKVILIGNLGNNPETAVTQAGNSVANISVATSETWKDKQTGHKQERTEWHRVVFFGKLAEIAGTYLKKGSKVYVEGKLRTRKWQDNAGHDRYTTEVAADTLQMLDSAQAESTAPPAPVNPNHLNPDGSPKTPQQMAAAQAPDFDDDVPY